MIYKVVDLFGNEEEKAAAEKAAAIVLELSKEEKAIIEGLE